MKNIYLKLFITISIIIIGVISQSYTIEMMNTHDDIISAWGLIFTCAITLFIVWVIVKLWYNNKNKKQWKTKLK